MKPAPFTAFYLRRNAARNSSIFFPLLAPSCVFNAVISLPWGSCSPEFSLVARLIPLVAALSITGGHLFGAMAPARLLFLNEGMTAMIDTNQII